MSNQWACGGVLIGGVNNGPKNGTSQRYEVAFLSIPTRIKEERERLGLSQTQLSAVAGATKKTQIRWEQEAGASPDAEALFAWSQIGIDVQYIVTGERSSSAAQLALPPDQQLLLEAYHALTPAKRKALLADLLTGGKKAKPKAEGGINVSGTGHRVAGRDYNGD